jgi:hypothetical protein
MKSMYQTIVPVEKNYTSTCFSPQFKNVVHIDNKWSNMMLVSERVYFEYDDEPPQAKTRHKDH